MIAIQTATTVDIYMPGNNPVSGRFLRYRMQRKPVLAINSDVWRWNEVWEMQRTGERAFATVKQICTLGEVELAIQQTGKSDFMGGAFHGWHKLTSVTMLVDGVAVPLGAVATVTHYPRTVEFLQASELYERDSSPLNCVAKVYTRWQFQDGEVEISHRVEWVASIEIYKTYLAMLPLIRTDVSDKGYRAPLYEEENIAVAGFAEVQSKSARAKASGAKGYSAEVEVLAGWDKPGRFFFVSSDVTYNKFYFNFTGPGYQTIDGEVFESRARYRLDTRN